MLKFFAIAGAAALLCGCIDTSNWTPEQWANYRQAVMMQQQVQQNAYNQQMANIRGSNGYGSGWNAPRNCVSNQIGNSVYTNCQ
jgi:hypothetical protein